MAHIVQFPRMNPVKFVPLGEVPNSLYNYRHDDNNWFTDTIQSWQRKVRYNQKWQLDDLISMQFHASPSSHTLEIINCSQAVIETIPLQAAISLPGNNYNGSPLSTYQYQFVPDDISLAEGKYWLLLTVTFPDDVEQQYISEPFKVKAVWSNTILTQFSHSSNEYDVVFSLNPRFSFRIESTLAKPRPVYEDVGFDDQQRNKKMLNSELNQQQDFIIGFRSSVPYWTLKHLAEAFRCSRVLLDKKQFVKPENEQWEVEDKEPTPLINATLVVQEQNKWQNYTFGDASLVIYVSPLAYPYYVDPIFLLDGGSPIQLSEAREVLSSGDEADFIDELNASAVLEGLLGTISLDGANIIYDNADGEGFDDATTTVRTKRMEFDLTAGVGETLTYLVRGTHGRVYGDGVVSTYEWTGPGSESVAKAYTSGGSYTFKLYHNDDVTLLSFLRFAGEVELTTADSVLPVGMTHYNIVGHGLTAFDLDDLLPAGNTLTSVIIKQNAVAALTGNPFPNNGFAAINTMDFSVNEISASDIDDLFNNIQNDAAFNGWGLIDTSGQTPAAPPTGASSAARTILSNAGINIITD